MLAQARETAMHEGLQLDEPTWVPGSMEKPLALKKAFRIFYGGSVDRQMFLPERCYSVAFRGQLVLVDQRRQFLELEPVFCCQVECKDFQ